MALSNPRVALDRRPDDEVILIERLLHRLFESADRLHFFLEALGVADGLKADIFALQPAETHAVALVARGDPGLLRTVGLQPQREAAIAVRPTGGAVEMPKLIQAAQCAGEILRRSFH